MRDDLGTWMWDEGKVSISFSDFRHAKFRGLNFFLRGENVISLI